MNTSKPILVLALLSIAGLAFGVTVLAPDAELWRSESDPSDNPTSARASTSAKAPALMRAAVRSVALDDGHGVDEESDERPMEAVQTEAREAAADARRFEDAVALANRRELFARNLESVETAATAAEAQGDRARAQALRMRLERLSERQRAEGLD